MTDYYYFHRGTQPLYDKFFNNEYYFDEIKEELLNRWNHTDSVEGFFEQFSKKDYEEILNHLSSYKGDEFSFSVGVFSEENPRSYVAMVYDYIRKMIFDALAVGCTDVLQLCDILISLENFQRFFPMKSPVNRCKVI